eukprot:GDKJ01015733.1.p1 GENE.GDKJ01015733.1~~GDKJ01015733.1.p1  ORF type:complete len:316 (-),score=22.75 GDKJ01015733.1:266-1168(-)
MSFVLRANRKKYIFFIIILIFCLFLTIYTGTSLFTFKHFRNRKIQSNSEVHSHYFHKKTANWSDEMQHHLSFDNVDHKEQIHSECRHESIFFPIDGPCYAHMDWVQWWSTKAPPKYILLFSGTIINVIFPGAKHISPEESLALRRFAFFRIISYVFLCVYRIAVLFLNLHFLLNFFFDKFDFSDHVVMVCTDLLIVFTEFFYRILIAFSRRTVEKSVPLFLFVCHSLLFVVLSLYSTFHTSRAFHYPSESWFGLALGIFGSIVPGSLCLFSLFNQYAPVVGGVKKNRNEADTYVLRVVDC